MKISLIIVLTFFCLLANIQGQGQKDMNSATALFANDGITGAVKEEIINHIKQNAASDLLNLILSNQDDEKELIVSEINSKPFIRKAEFYYLTHRKAVHWSGIYIKFNNKFYTSLKTEDFENFLKDYDFLKESNSLNLFIVAYQNFHLKASSHNPDYLVTGDYLKDNRNKLKEFGLNEISPPIEKQTQNAEISFFVHNSLLKKITKVKVKISVDYVFQWELKTFQQGQPEISN